MSSFLIDHPRPRGREVVTLGCLNEPGRRCRQFHKVRHIEPARKKLREAHIGIGVRAGKQQLIGIGIAGRNDRFKSRVQSADEGGQCPTSRATRGAQTCGVHVRPADQVVDAPLRIPDEEEGRALANQHALGSRLDMLGNRPAPQGARELPIIRLFPFTLTDRIGRQHHKAFQGQIGGRSLRLGLSLLGMAGLKKNGRVTARLVGPVEIAGDIEIRQTLEKHLLDGVALSLNLTGDFGIQRPVVVGQTAQEFQKRFADLLFPALRIGNGMNLVNRPLPLLKLPLRNLVHPAEQGVSNGLLRTKGAGEEKRCA